MTTHTYGVVAKLACFFQSSVFLLGPFPSVYVTVVYASSPGVRLSTWRSHLSNERDIAGVDHQSLECSIE